jgi:polar amino acid transport system permease protein
MAIVGHYLEAGSPFVFTSLAAIIGVVELTKSGMVIANMSFEPMLVYGLIAAIYFAMCWPMSLLSRHLEKAQHATR